MKTPKKGVTENVTSSNVKLPRARVEAAHPYLALMGLFCGGFAGMYSETALNIALPQLSLAFGVDVSVTQWLVVGYMLVIGVVLPFAGLLMKWFSARKLTLFALGAFLVGAIVSAAAPSFAIAFVGRAMQGIGTGLVLPITFAMVFEVFPLHKVGAAMGASALVVMFAPAIGPTLAGALVGTGSWRLVFASFAVMALVGIVFAWKFEVNPFKLTKPAIDAPSVALSVVGFAVSCSARAWRALTDGPPPSFWGRLLRESRALRSMRAASFPWRCPLSTCASSLIRDFALVPCV